MSAPQKPWEDTRYTNHQQGVLGPGRNVLYSHAPQPTGQVPTMNTPVTVVQRASNLPPLPQRPQQLLNRPALGMAAPGFGSYPGYNAGYGSFGGIGVSSFGGYGGMYGVGGYGHGSFPVGGGFENRFLQVAEESSRDAFHSIESIVRAFTSVSMMLESTYFAMYSSFRAILGVVDNFSRLRQIFAQFLSTVTVLRIIRNFYRRLLHWLGVLDHSPQAERVWETVSGQAGEESTQVASSTKWPLITFFAFLFGGPYLISKLFSSNTSSRNQWDHSKGRYVKAAYPHQAGTEAELSFQASEVLNLAPRELQTFETNGWLLASNQSGRVGYVPVTRLVTTATIHVAAKTPVAATTTVPTASATPDQEAGGSQSNLAQTKESQ